MWGANVGSTSLRMLLHLKLTMKNSSFRDAIYSIIVDELPRKIGVEFNILEYFMHNSNVILPAC